ncbi:hypothetical protein LCGC14_2229290 [marine sediment metagenome]|uniref:Uncharacterized protein n=1 Tax=marine sediment metagenome TaxID=412755 RepID=A0A0F9D8N4_9ZZZZ
MKALKFVEGMSGVTYCKKCKVLYYDKKECNCDVKSTTNETVDVTNMEWYKKGKKIADAEDTTNESKSWYSYKVACEIQNIILNAMKESEDTKASSEEKK